MLEEKSKNKLLILIDDIYPAKLSAFRNEEFSNYLDNYENILIINISKISIDKKDINWKEKYPYKNIYFFQTNFNDNNMEKIKSILAKFKLKLASIVFLNNIYAFNGKILKFLEDNNISFMFTLYPGGGFFFDDESLFKLRKVFSSKCFYKVIVTQEKVLNFLEDNKLCLKEKIEYIYGIVTPKIFLNVDVSNHRHYGINGKINLNVCFVAFKYFDKGMDKGYDIFVEVAKKLRKMYSDIYFHVVGNFDENDINVDELYERIAFYGVQDSNWFLDFYKDKDIILSPTRPSVLHEGAFDGFPTGSSTEAMLNEILVLATDPLNLNKNYENEKEIMIIDTIVDNIVKIIIYLKEHPEEMYSMAKNGYDKANNIYSYEQQVLPRLNILKEMERLNYE